MEKLKPLIKHHFWILTGVVVLASIGVGVWSWMAAGDRINRQKSDILSAESKAKNVNNVRAEVADSAGPSVHPNAETIEGMSKEIDGGKDQVLAAWEKLYADQKDLLTWPGNVMDPEKSKYFDSLRPEQLKFDPNVAPQGDVIERYRKVVKTVFPDFMPALVSSVRAKWSAQDVMGEGAVKAPVVVASDEAKDDMEKLMFNEPIVDWSVADQVKWFGLLTNFKRNGNQSVDGTPTTIQVVYLKEDLVLLNGVLEIVKEANKNATVPSQAAIREISSIMIGKEAHEAKPMEVGSAASSAGGFMAEAEGRMDMMKQFLENMGGGNEKKKSTTVSASDIERLDPAHLRYIDKEFKPIAASKYRQSVSSNKLSPDSWMSVVKRVPVRLRLRVDERRIGEILEKCANAKIPLEVRQITLIGGELPPEAAAATTGRKGGPTNSRNPSVAGSGESMTIGDDDSSGAGGGGGPAGTGGAKEQTFKSPEFNSHFLVPLEIYGVMKFYSTPAPEALGRTTESTPAPSL
ncbi:MAG: hypothetical protein Q8M16_11920 [Pirellulaceae bacterium]|nr:hypothetical protein [Pirellulaceae bacterium]